MQSATVMLPFPPEDIAAGEHRPLEVHIPLHPFQLKDN